MSCQRACNLSPLHIRSYKIFDVQTTQMELELRDLAWTAVRMAPIIRPSQIHLQQVTILANLGLLCAMTEKSKVEVSLLS